MNRTRLLIVTLGLLLCALNGNAQSKIGSIRYTPAPEKDASEPLLNPRWIMQQMDPIPPVTFPRSFPVEFTLTHENLLKFRNIRKAQRNMAQKNYAEASRLYRMASGEDPQGLFARVGLADSLYAQGLHEEAAAEYERILALEPRGFQALNNYAWLLVTREDKQQRDPEKALDLITRAHALNPANHYAWSTLCRVQYELGLYQESVNSGQVAVRLAQEAIRRRQTTLNTQMSYLLQLERSQMALEATSLLE